MDTYAGSDEPDCIRVIKNFIIYDNGPDGPDTARDNKNFIYLYDYGLCVMF